MTMGAEALLPSRTASPPLSRPGTAASSQPNIHPTYRRQRKRRASSFHSVGQRSPSRHQGCAAPGELDSEEAGLFREAIKDFVRVQVGGTSC